MRWRKNGSVAETCDFWGRRGVFFRRCSRMHTFGWVVAEPLSRSIISISDVFLGFSPLAAQPACRPVIVASWAHSPPANGRTAIHSSDHNFLDASRPMIAIRQCVLGRNQVRICRSIQPLPSFRGFRILRYHSHRSRLAAQGNIIRYVFSNVPV